MTVGEKFLHTTDIDDMSPDGIPAVTTGIPAIFAYPITSGIARAAREMPAMISMGTWAIVIGRIP